MNYALEDILILSYTYHQINVETANNDTLFAGVDALIAQGLTFLQFKEQIEESAAID